MSDINDAKSIITTIITNKLNLENRRLYKEIYNVMSGIQNNYENKVFKKDKYSVLMEKLDEILSQYREQNDLLDFNSTASIESTLEKIYEIRKKLVEICSEGGCKRISQILCLYLGYEYDSNLSEKYKKLLEFYENFFIPTSAAIETESIVTSTEILPYPKKNNCSNKSFLEKIEGADIYFPFGSKNIIISGYFNKDPLNITRIGGTIGEKLKKTQEQIKFLAIEDNFKNGFLNQLSLRDFLLNNEVEIGDIISNAHKDLLKYRTKPLSLLVKEFITGNTEKQRYVLTLFLLSDSEDQFLAHIIYDMICNTSELLKPQPMAEEIYKVFIILSKNYSELLLKMLKLKSNNYIP